MVALNVSSTSRSTGTRKIKSFVNTLLFEEFYIGRCNVQYFPYLQYVVSLMSLLENWRQETNNQSNKDRIQCRAVDSERDYFEKELDVEVAGLSSSGEASQSQEVLTAEALSPPVIDLGAGEPPLSSSWKAEISSSFSFNIKILKKRSM